ncbi:MAG: 3-isopropylmalate dehydratase large subunit [Fibrobacterota bacterium]|nr:3-isopropylmalate dehydratase large subunit [Fibrobacterota bacterium]
MGKNLYHKVFDKHSVGKLSSGQYQLFIGLHLIHEVTSPQAFSLIKQRGLKVRYPQRTFATVDHIIPTEGLERKRPLRDSLAEEMLVAIEDNTKANGITFFGEGSGKQGVVHIIGPEMGLTQPGQTIACGDSHTSTHGAFGSLAFGIGTSQVADILATQTMSMSKLKVRKINVTGKLRPGIYAKDVILAIINKLGVNGGVGYAYEYAGPVISAFSMEERMTLCNMSIEGGARIGYVNPDEKTYAYLKGREYSPTGPEWNKALAYWQSIASDTDADYDDVVDLDGTTLEPFVTWGITPGQSIPVTKAIPSVASFPSDERPLIKEALEYMSLEEGQAISGVPVDVVFIGSCTNGRLSDLQEVARLVAGRKVSPKVKALIVPGSMEVQRQAEALGLKEIFTAAGFQWREPGCSMCLAMNPDKLQGRQICASTSNRNFKGRQGSSSGRTLLMSPAMAAAAAIEGKVSDSRVVFEYAKENA